VTVANEEHLELLRQGIASWNEWREKNRALLQDLRDADLSEELLDTANLSYSNLTNAQLVGAILLRANLKGAIFANANLGRARFTNSTLTFLFEEGFVQWQ
jgi:uncharacterized protein YjbI with pentapeptide repeats